WVGRAPSLDCFSAPCFSVARCARCGTVALAAARRDGRWIAAPFALGAFFLGGQGSEYLRLLQTGVGPQSALFGTTFFTLTGLHGLHVLVGLIALAALSLASLSRRGAVRPAAAEAVSIYWYCGGAARVLRFRAGYGGP